MKKLLLISLLITASIHHLHGAVGALSGPLFPKDSTSVLYAFGDSQTAGFNFSGASYTVSGSFIQNQYRWVDMLATNGSRSMVVSNCGIGASQLACGGASIPPSSIFNSMGRLTNTWTGVTTIMAGWNDLGNYPANDAFFETMTHAYEAAIARSLIDDYFALSVFGWTRTSFINNDTPSWASSGVNYQWTTTDRDSIPFWFVSGGVGSQARYAAAYTGAQTNQFLVLFKKAVGIFFDTTPNSGEVTVLLNQTNLVGRYNLNTGSLDAAAHWPYVVWIDHLPTNALITITNNLAANKTNLVIAAGYVNYYTRRPSRTVVVGTTTADTNSIGSPFAAGGQQRSLTNLYSLAKAAESAASSFADLGYPVYLANNFNAYVNSTDPEPTDISHFTPTGHRRIFEAFASAYRPSGYSSSNVVAMPRVRFHVQ